ncbi:MAG: LuxR C-terminal-related transcriptional regulator [Lachnospiraceae bacterium]|nr:LuxR C-terminal-related transcriptional regulator [Lachnospiraceae bacterium]
MARKSDYIKPRIAWKRLTTAQSLGQTLYIYGVTGYGKTELVKQYLDEYKYVYFSCRSGRLYEPERKVRRNKKQSEVTDGDGAILQTFVIDDLQFLKDPEDREIVLSMIRDESKWVILISRSPLLPWIKTIYMNEGMQQIAETELAWTKNDVGVFFQKHSQINLTEEEQQTVHTFSMGNPLSVRSINRICEELGGYDATCLEKSWHDYEDYLIEQLMQEWNRDLRKFLMHMSFMEVFNVALAEMVTGNTDAHRLIQEALEIGNFMIVEQPEQYKIRPLLRTALQKRARNTYGSEKIRDIYYNAGLYYEMQDDIPNALAMYEISGNNDRIKEILIRNAGKNPGNGHYYELRKYYFSIKEEEIEKDVVLMSGISMLYSLLLQPELSDKWYEKLKQCEQKLEGAEKREARSRLTYLDIALPHRGINGIIDIIKSVPRLLFDKGISLPEFSVTSNLPSVMNGGKDFCQWSKKDRELAASIGKVLSRVLGRYGKGLVEIALAESQYEKGGDDFEIISLLSKGAMSADSGGMLEMIYAVMGIQTRMNLLHGNEEAANEILNNFQEYAVRETAKEILKNLAAQKCRISLYEGDAIAVAEWMKQAPEEEKEFYILERYRYLTKVRCYMFQGEYYRALALLERLTFYADMYERTYIQIESSLLRTIIQYRMHKKEWKETILGVVKKAESYSFYRVISEEGAAVWELFQEDDMKKHLYSACGEEYITKLLYETHTMARNFPQYLVRDQAEKFEFKGNALAVLRLMADGFTYNEIAEKLNIKLETVRYHCNQNYKKLGVDGKVEAVLAARNLRIL